MCNDKGCIDIQRFNLIWKIVVIIIGTGKQDLYICIYCMCELLYRFHTQKFANLVVSCTIIIFSTWDGKLMWVPEFAFTKDNVGGTWTCKDYTSSAMFWMATQTSCHVGDVRELRLCMRSQTDQSANQSWSVLCMQHTSVWNTSGACMCCLHNPSCISATWQHVSMWKGFLYAYPPTTNHIILYMH